MNNSNDISKIKNKSEENDNLISDKNVLAPKKNENGNLAAGIIANQCKDILDQISDEELKTLVRDLRRKIEYNDNMNWLCLSRRTATQPDRKPSLPNHIEVKKRFFQICNTNLSEEVKSALRLPSFDSYDWDDADVLNLMQTMFLELGLVEKFSIPLTTLREWLYEVYKHYNAVPFHNFRHCFCVAQMMYAILKRTDVPSKLGDLEVMILLVSCICHDLDHPGYNNIYQINARTELALRYNDISPLENHHCSIAFRLLEHPDCNIFKTLGNENYKQVREGVIRCILATDMARHNEILEQFIEITPVFDYSKKSHTNLLCMVLIKVADISNEARPIDVAEPWLDRLLQEFFAQSALEKSEGLPVTPFMDPDKVSKPGSQVRFIGLVLLPLFEALGQLLPELTELIIAPVRWALDYYKRLNDAQIRIRRSIVETDEGGGDDDGRNSPLIPRSQSGMSVKSKKSIPSQKSTSRTSIDETNQLQDLPEGSESEDSETATEVDVAEKASKFKVDTESSNRIFQSSSSRKGSHESKRPSTCSYGNINSHSNQHSRLHFGGNRAVSLEQYGSNRRMSDCLILQSHNTSCSEKEENTSEIIEQKSINLCNNTNSSLQSSNGAKTFMSRLRQLTGRLSFSFDKDPRRITTSCSSSSGSNISTKRKIKNDLIINTTTSQERNRAYSLDVPENRSYISCNNSHDGSRKSSTSRNNDDENKISGCNI